MLCTKTPSKVRQNAHRGLICEANRNVVRENNHCGKDYCDRP